MVEEHLHLPGPPWVMYSPAWLKTIKSSRGTYRTCLQLSNWHFTTETWAYSEDLAFSEKISQKKKTPGNSLFFFTTGSLNLNFLIFFIETLQPFFFNISMGLLISILLSESIFNVGKWSNWKCVLWPNWVNAHIFSLTPFRKRKLIPKADLK